jgi:DGQHR domain-containing protein
VAHQSRATLKRTALQATGIVLHQAPDVYLTALPGPWLLEHSTPSWRIDDPHKGFQRIVKDQRAKEIARTVLDTHRTFPNAITLATTTKSFELAGDQLDIPANAKFLVVDGQHRLWAQYHSEVSGTYPCVIHMDRTEQQMAALFLEINDTQKRVPSSLRWDLYRLVRTEDQSKLMTADIVYELATRKESPFYSVGIDLTGERQDVTIKQGSLAPEIKKLVSSQLKKHGDDIEDYVALFIRFFVAIRSLDPEGWGNPEESTFYHARVLRALIRVLSDILATTTKMSDLSTDKLRKQLARIDQATLSKAEVRRIQGSAGVQDLYKQMREQVVRSARA